MSKRIKKWLVCYSYGVLHDENKRQYIANHFDLVNFANGYHTQMQDIKSKNPNIKCLVYMSSRATQDTFDNWNEINPHEDWFLHTITGERIKHCLWKGYMMNISPDVGWSDYYGNKALERINTYGYDGIFADTASFLENKLCELDASTPVPDDQVVPSDIWDKWPGSCAPVWLNCVQPHHWMYQHIGNAKTIIGNKILMNNSGKNYLMSEDHDTWHCYEGFMHNDVNDNMGWIESSARNVIKELHDLNKKDRNICVISKLKDGTPEQNEEWCKRCWCFFAIAVDNPNKAWFAWNFCHNYDTCGYLPVMDTEIGNPITDYTEIDEITYPGTEVFVREFEKVWILANNSRVNTSTVNVNGTDYTLDPRECEIIYKEDEMAEHITDTKTFSVAIKIHGNLGVSNIVAPTEVYENETFDVSYDVTNDGGTDTCFGRVTDGTSLIAGSGWNEPLNAGQTKTYTVTGITAPLNGVIEVGYID